MKGIWWKAIGVALVLYSIIQGLLGPVPALNVLNETIRVLYFHVPMWFSMILMLLLSLIYSIKTLRGNLKWDIYAEQFARTAFLLALLGLTTGMVWARFTWGAFWTNDPKLQGTAVTILTYLAYFILRNSVEDPHKRSRLAGVYNIFAFVMMIVFIGILPRITDSLHPGMGGNPGFNEYDLDDNMRRVFYPAVVGWMLMGLWISSLSIRIQKLNYAQEN
ncbi:cytochrome c biogenesis protein CcsA [Croceimicrobium sp.]|uniref:cytochrome c biogenesis protein CcsA n=1 Tax=Croceimicrobium sp. TaxID=2828340 RepID=UPI003BACB05C